MSPTRLTWLDRGGRELGTITGPGDFVNVVLSPDGKRVAYALVDPEQNAPDLWLLDLQPGAVPSRFTFDPGLDTHPVWSPDGSRVVFRSYRNGIGELYEKRSSGGSEELLPLSGFDKSATDWSRNGSVIVYQRQSERAATLFDIWTLRMADREHAPFVEKPFSETQGKLSPDGRFIAYTSNERGRLEVWVRSFPDSGELWQVSADNGAEPIWRADGRELFYIRADRMLMAVPITATGGFERGVPRELFTMPISTAQINAYRSNYAAGADGQRFLVNAVVPGEVASLVTVLLNWVNAVSD
jgi:Tol biopolymer transport system component